MTMAIHSSGSNWAEHVRKAAEEVDKRYPDKFNWTSTYPGHGENSAKGAFAVDFMTLRERGDKIAAYVWKHRKRLNVRYVIWWGRIISETSNTPNRWVRYFNADNPNPSKSHKNHVHVSFYPKGTYRPLEADKPVVKPPTDKPSGPPTLVKTIGPMPSGLAPRTLWQDFSQNAKTKEIFLSIEKGEDTVYVRCSPEGKPLNIMTVEGTRFHGTSFGVSDTNILWSSHRGDIVTLQYKTGATKTGRDATVMHTFSDLPSQCNVSPTGKYILVRVMEGTKNHWRVYSKANILANVNKMHGVQFTTHDKDHDPLQGFSLYKDIVKLLFGETNGPSRIEKWDSRNGKKVGSLDLTPWLKKTYSARGKYEVEGYDANLFGVKFTPFKAGSTTEYDLSKRVLDIYRDNF